MASSRAFFQEPVAEPASFVPWHMDHATAYASRSDAVWNECGRWKLQLRIPGNLHSVCPAGMRWSGGPEQAVLLSLSLQLNPALGTASVALRSQLRADTFAGLSRAQSLFACDARQVLYRLELQPQWDVAPGPLSRWHAVGNGGFLQLFATVPYECRLHRWGPASDGDPTARLPFTLFSPHGWEHTVVPLPVGASVVAESSAMVPWTLPTAAAPPAEQGAATETKSDEDEPVGWALSPLCFADAAASSAWFPWTGVGDDRLDQDDGGPPFRPLADEWLSGSFTERSGPEMELSLKRDREVPSVFSRPMPTGVELTFWDVRCTDRNRPHLLVVDATVRPAQGTVTRSVRSSLVLWARSSAECAEASEPMLLCDPVARRLTVRSAPCTGCEWMAIGRGLQVHVTTSGPAHRPQHRCLQGSAYGVPFLMMIPGQSYRVHCATTLRLQPGDTVSYSITVTPGAGPCNYMSRQLRTLQCERGAHWDHLRQDPLYALECADVSRNDDRDSAIFPYCCCC